MSKKNIYKNLGSLEPIKKLLQEASDGLGDDNRTIQNSSIPEVLGAALGGGLGAAGSFAALYLLGTTGLSAAGITSGLAAAGLGGGMVVGIGVLAAPAVILAVGGYAIVKHHNDNRLAQAKENLLKEIMAKHDAVLEALKNRVDKSEERAKYLESLVILLRQAGDDLNHDLGKS